ncbi:hypothetical protein LVO79_01905 [Roseivivax marinus]|jgi:transcription elongation factor Elf1|uniref:hypothetical protein n=1 Tax=Roseivivax marinus TaxID=1379903 RepID=UPI001F042BDA|nr:hypothetical protein [Roseivivax marinus]UMA65251.1 hypothetical protein LVO79_01905 [Roseivivax marinus]
MPSNTSSLFDCRTCGQELTSIYAIVQTAPIFERYLHFCPTCDKSVEGGEAVLRKREARRG